MNNFPHDRKELARKTGKTLFLKISKIKEQENSNGKMNYSHTHYLATSSSICAKLCCTFLTHIPY